MSARTGTLLRVKVSAVSSEAAISGRAAFLAPPIGITPSSGTPPFMQILSIASIHAPPPSPVAPSYSIGGQAAVGLLLLDSEPPLKPAARHHLPSRFWGPPRRDRAEPEPAPCAAADCRATPQPNARRGRHGPPSFWGAAVKVRPCGDATRARRPCQAAAILRSGSSHASRG